MNKIEQQMHMYGCETTELDSLMSEAIIIGEERDLPMLAMSILSDAQHVMAHGDVETARQVINRAKYVILTEKGLKK